MANDRDNAQQDGAPERQRYRYGVFAYQSNDDLKRVAKAYRTEIASGTASVLSTFVAVSGPLCAVLA